MNSIINHLKILTREIDAGNNNPELVNQILILLKKLKTYHKLINY